MEETSQIVKALEARCAELETDRDRYFNMKRINAGLHARVRARLQDARAALLPLKNLGSVAQALEILDKFVPADPWLSKLLETYREKAGKVEVGERGQHLQMMCDKGQEDKANRWLGFLQGVFWKNGTYSIDQLRAHMRGEAP